MKLIFIGPQGCGKGTQAKKVAEKFGLCHISAGDLLRGVSGEIKERVDGIMNSGKMVPDEIIEELLLEKISGEDCEKGFILDGFPRTVKQAESVKGKFDVNKVIEISISDEESVRRISGRRGCKKCGAIYNVTTTPKPKVEGVCDECGGELFQRDDDSEGALRERLKIYHKETEKILEMYDSVKIDGEQSIEKVLENILEVLN
jgi:adenylate kinase